MKKLVCSLAIALGLTMTGHAQYNPLGGTAEEVQPGVTSFAPAGGGQIRVLQRGEPYEVDGKRYVAGEEVEAPKVSATSNVKIGGEEYRLVPKRRFGSVSFFPVGTWSVAGQLYDNNQGFIGGTRTVSGTIFAADFGYRPDPHRRGSIELGGWYFKRDRATSNDIYQVHMRYFWQPDLGLQLAYIDSPHFDASSATAHVIFNLDAQGKRGLLGKSASIQLGLGVLNNFTGTQFPQTGNRHSLNFSSFVLGSIEIRPRLRAVASQWYVRDRNIDFSRFALGLSYQF